MHRSTFRVLNTIMLNSLHNQCSIEVYNIIAHTHTHTHTHTHAHTHAHIHTHTHTHTHTKKLPRHHELNYQFCSFIFTIFLCVKGGGGERERNVGRFHYSQLVQLNKHTFVIT